MNNVDRYDISEDGTTVSVYLKTPVKSIQVMVTIDNGEMTVEEIEGSLREQYWGLDAKKKVHIVSKPTSLGTMCGLAVNDNGFGKDELMPYLEVKNTIFRPTEQHWYCPECMSEYDER